MRPRLFSSRIIFTLVWIESLLGSATLGHDIPNARVDRSIQVTLESGMIRVAYEVSLAELTLTQELRSLVGTLPGADRREWFAAYGQETGPLDAKGFLVLVDGEPVAVKVDGFALVVEEHPRFTFRFIGAIPDAGHLTVLDTNYRQSEGTSRLAIRGVGVAVKGDNLPTDVDAIPERPVWQLSDEEEKRTRGVSVDYQPSKTTATPVTFAPIKQTSTEESSSLTRLVDRAAKLPLAILTVMAFGLGAAHALQPGHGKTLVAATMLGEHSTWKRGTILATATTLTHMGSVLVVAAGLWWTESTRFPEIHLALSRGSGFLIAAVGLWRLGRLFGGCPSHPEDHPVSSSRPASLIGLGIAGGIVPCWDAVGLIVLSAAVDKIGLGILLVGVFSIGMGTVLVAIGVLASVVRSSWSEKAATDRLEPALSATSGVFLTAIGVYLLSF